MGERGLGQAFVGAGASLSAFLASGLPAGTVLWWDGGFLWLLIWAEPAEPCACGKWGARPGQKTHCEEKAEQVKR